MIRTYVSYRIVFALGMVLALLALSLASRAVRAGQAAQQGQSDQNQGQSQEKSKKKGGFFDSVKSTSNTTSSSNSDSSSGSSQGSSSSSNQGSNPGSSSSQGSNPGSSSNKQQNSDKGGFFKGLKAATGSSSQQTAATASAGTKGVDEDGQTIANVTPTSADQQAVAAMESYSLPQGALPKFIEGGNLKAKQ